MGKENDIPRKRREEARDDEDFSRFHYADGSVYEGRVGRREAPPEIPLGMGLTPGAPQRNALPVEGITMIPIQHGKGVLKDASGAIYEGVWVDGAISGDAALQFPSGGFYRGGVYRNTFHGIGTYTWSDGSSYEGQWENNKMHGLGTYVDAQGKRWVGKFYQGYGTGLLAEIII